MHIALSLVGIIFLGMQCHSRGIPSENDRQYRVETFYQPNERRNLKQERVLQQVPRATNQHQETNQPQQTQYEAVYVKNAAPSRPKRGKRLPKIEQYLKEVTPTTKTAFNPIIFKAESQLLPLYEQYVRESSKPVPIAQNILAIQNAILARENAIYERQRADQLQRQIGEKPHSEPIENYELSKPDVETIYYPNNNQQYNDEAEEEDEPEEKQAEPQYEQQQEDDDEEEEEEKAPPPVQKLQKSKEPSPDREIVYYHNVEYERETGSKHLKSTTSKKQPPKEAPAQEEEEEDDEESDTPNDEENGTPNEEENDSPNEEENDYNQKEEYNPQSDREEYEDKEPSPPKYQAKLSGTPKLILPTEAGLGHLYEPVTPNSPVYPKAGQSPKKPKEQIYVSDVKYEKNVVYKPGQPKEEVSYYVDPSAVQYHLEEAGTNNYIIDQNNVHRPQVQQYPTEQNYQKYSTNVAQYHDVPSAKSSKPRGRVVTHYVLIPQPVAANNQESYQPQQYVQPHPPQQQQKGPSQERSSYLGPSDEDYRQSELKQKLGRNSSLRILKTGKPVVFIGHEE